MIGISCGKSPQKCDKHPFALVKTFLCLIFCHHTVKNACHEVNIDIRTLMSSHKRSNSDKHHTVCLVEITIRGKIKW